MACVVYLRFNLRLESDGHDHLGGKIPLRRKAGKQSVGNWGRPLVERRMVGR